MLTESSYKRSVYFFSSYFCIAITNYNLARFACRFQDAVDIRRDPIDIDDDEDTEPYNFLGKNELNIPNRASLDMWAYLRALSSKSNVSKRKVLPERTEEGEHLNAPPTLMINDTGQDKLQVDITNWIGVDES